MFGLSQTDRAKFLTRSVAVKQKLLTVKKKSHRGSKSNALIARANCPLEPLFKVLIELKCQWIKK